MSASRPRRLWRAPDKSRALLTNSSKSPHFPGDCAANRAARAGVDRCAAEKCARRAIARGESYPQETSRGGGAEARARSAGRAVDLSAAEVARLSALLEMQLKAVAGSHGALRCGWSAVFARRAASKRSRGRKGSVPSTHGMLRLRVR